MLCCLVTLLQNDNVKDKQLTHIKEQHDRCGFIKDFSFLDFLIELSGYKLNK